MATDSLAPEDATPQDDSGSAAPAPEIRPIERSAVARICSGQVVVDLATAVKELLENSIDAGATQLEIKLKEWGVDHIEVSDNGSGVAPKDYQGLTLKYHTSKISEFGDLWSVQSFGFRGEALSSLCEISGSFEVTTRTDEQSVGTRLSYDRTGTLLGREAVARQRGTTISITNLFEPLPVRRAELRRTVSKQTAKLLRVLQSYALVCTGVRITCYNIKGPKGTRQLVLSTQGGHSMRENIVNIFGASFVSTLQPLELEVSGEEGDKRVSGFVSKTGEGVGRSDNDRQFFFLNGRPVDMPKVTRLVNEVWRHYEMKHKPAAMLNVDAPAGSFDVNVTPDKREVLLVGEAALLEQLKERLHGLWQSANASRAFEVNQAQKTELGHGAVGSQPASMVVAGSGKKRAREEEEKGEEAGRGEELEARGQEEGAQQEPARQVAEAMVQDGGSEGEEGPVVRRRKIDGDVVGRAGVYEEGSQDTASLGEGSVREKGRRVEVEEEEDEEEEEGSQEEEGVSAEEGGADFEGEEELVDLPIAALSTGPMRTSPAVGKKEGSAAWNRQVGDEADEGEDEEEEEEEEEEEQEQPSTAVRGRRPSQPLSASPSASATSSLARFRAGAVDKEQRAAEGAPQKKGAGGKGAGGGGRLGKSKRGGTRDIPSPPLGGIRRFLTNFASMTSAAGNGRAQGGTIAGKSLGFQLEVEGGGGEEAAATAEDEEEEDIMSISSSEDEGSTQGPPAELNGTGAQAAGGKGGADRPETEEEVEEEAMVTGSEGGMPVSPRRSKRGEVVVMGEEEDDEVIVVEQSTPQRRLSLSSRAQATPTSPHMDKASQRSVGSELLDSLTKARGPRVTAFRFDPHAALRACAAKAAAPTATPTPEPSSCLSAALSAECSTDPERGKDCEAAARVFSRVLNKGHFQQMVVLGQFNLGFIIVRVGSDIFILDQHACDEKYNFETLQASTTIHEQRLILPLPFEASAMEEVVILDNLGVFRQNGFRFLVDEEAPPMKRLQVTALPYSKGVQFGVEDIHELASQLSENPGQMLRLPKIRHMFASRACRMSIMIGKPLTRPQMVKVVRNLGKIEQPWNCPHGRPTMRHLVDLNRLHEK